MSSCHLSACSAVQSWSHHHFVPRQQEKIFGGRLLIVSFGGRIGDFGEEMPESELGD